MEDALKSLAKTIESGLPEGPQQIGAALGAHAGWVIRGSTIYIK
jgi:hypothetical protein